MQPLEKGGTVQFFHLKTSPVGCLMFLIWPRDNYSRNKSPHSNSNYFALLAWVLHVCFANLFKLSRNSQPRQCDSSSGVVFPFALYTGEERKKKRNQVWQMVGKNLFICLVPSSCAPPFLYRVLGTETHGAELLFEQTRTCRTASGGTPARLGAAPPPASHLSPDRKQPRCPCLWLLIYPFNDISNSRKDRLDLRELLHCS